MDMYAAYLDVGTFRGAAAMCGTSHHTVKDEVLKHLVGAERQSAKAQRAKNTDIVTDLVDKRVRSSHGRISAKRLLPVAVATPDRPATSGAWWPRPSAPGERRTTGAGDRASGSRARCSSSTGAPKTDCTSSAP